MTRLAAISLAIALAAPAANAQLSGQPPLAQQQPVEKSKREAKSQNDRRPPVDLEWLWQYTPAPESPEGNEHALIQDPHFVPFLQATLIAPQAFWGPQSDDKPRKTLADTAFDFLAIPNKVLADDNRYVTVTGCVFRFCPSRGLLWADLNSGRKSKSEPLVVFAAIDWIRESKVTTDPAAEYTLWLFPSIPMSTTPGSPNRIPPALLRSLLRWAHEPIARTGITQRITHAVLVDPDGTPHEFKPETIGITDPAKPEASK